MPRPAPSSPALPVDHRQPPISGKFEGDFEARLRAADEGQKLYALIDLSGRLDLPRFGEEVRAARRDKRSRRLAVIGAMERVAERQQAELGPTIDRLLASGAIDRVVPIAIVNRLVVHGRASGILALAGRPQVTAVLPEWGSEDGAAEPATLVPEPETLGDHFSSWALAALGAPALWAQGFDGSGVVVAAIDTGVDAEHEQLFGHRLEGARGWYDPAEGRSVPIDDHGHGTSVLSEAVGQNPDGRLVGVAPGARWAVARGNLRNRYSRVRVSLAADWVLRVARPDVLVNAWSHGEDACTTFDLPFIDAWKAAEIFVVFPAGNAGPAEASGEPPASLSGVYPGDRAVLSVAGLDAVGSVHATSSRGPSRCGGKGFPTLAAPGALLPYASISGNRSYAVGTGTSLAAGLVGGAAALLLQADPELTPDGIEEILVDSCRDLPPRGRDDASGAGSVDLPAALARVMAARARRAPG